MRERTNRDSKVKALPFLVGATLAGVCIAGTVLLVRQLWPLSAPLSGPPVIALDGESNPATVSVSKNSVSPPAPTPVLTQNPVAKAKADPKAIAAQQGLLRVGNPTDYPVRVALLLKRPGAAKEPTNDPASAYETPAHWDFEPGEGGSKGLLLSLPNNRKIKLKKGDILVAFAQDGSRRYWGPYVVGETPDPVWNPGAAEWDLTLEP